MSANSKIQWTNHTVNFVIGCNKVDELCVNCYADEMDERRFSKTLPGHSKAKPIRHWGPNAPRYMRIEEARAELLALDRKARIAGRIDKVFINSLSDTFEGRIDLDGARLALFNTIDKCQNLIFQLVTKRPENVLRMVPWKINWPWNVWLLTSVGNQRTADERIPELLKIPAIVRGLSIEPMLGPISLKLNGQSCTCDNCLGSTRPCGFASLNAKGWACRAAARGLDWVIVGGESGQNARPCNIDWIRRIVAQCQSASVPVFVKQLGANPQSEDAATRAMEIADGKKRAWKLYFTDKKGGDWNEWSGDLESLRIREFPEAKR